MFSPEAAAPNSGPLQFSYVAAVVALARRHAPDCGFERSFKLSPGGFDDQRFLISFAVGGGAAWQASFLDALSQLDLPRAASEEIAATLPAARFIHLGYEQPRGVTGLKVYLEFDISESDLVHRSFKWRPDEGMGFAVDEYRRLHDRSPPAFNAPTPFVRALKGFTAISAKLAPEDDFRLAVTRRGGSRASFDLRLYDAELRVAEADALVAPVAIACGCRAEYARALHRHGREPLGHIAAGTGGDGLPYLTVYHGAETLQ